MKLYKIIFISFCLIWVGNSFAQEVSDKKDKIGRSLPDTARIDPYGNEHIVLTGDDLADASFPKSWPLFGSNARLGFGGYAKLDYIQDFNGMHHDRFEFVLAHIHVPDAGIPAEEPYMNLFARESRFHFDFRTKNKYGTPLQIYLEMDFWNLDRDAFHNVPRLRHFYAVYGDFLVGRTWGLLTNLQAMPNIIDFEGSDAVLISRRAQFRYQPQIKDKLKVGVALEMLEYPDIDGNGFNGQPSMLLPILSTNITRNTKFGGNIMFGGSIYQLRWDGLETGPNTNAIYLEHFSR